MARTSFAGATFKPPTLETPAYRAPAFRVAARFAVLTVLAGLLTACGGRNYAAGEDNTPRSGPTRKFDPKYDKSVFGEGGVSFSNVRSGGGGILADISGANDDKARLPVNKYLWQGALDTLSFLPLASTDPFTGVIATDWGSTPEAPGERFKVTAYILNPGLSAGALKVAVFREVRNESGLWLPAPASADTARQLEDAILTRARQIRIAEVEGSATG